MSIICLLNTVKQIVHFLRMNALRYMIHVGLFTQAKMQMDSGWVRCWFNRWDLTTNHFFDQSSAHGAFAKDALNANETNVKPGGNQCCMHATVIPNDNLNPELHDQPQDMVFPVNLPSDHKYYEFCGQAKGMKVILKEWGLWNHLCTLNGG